jgi:hypothetical protein
MTPSEISGTSILKSSTSISWQDLDKISCGPRDSVLISVRMARTRSLIRKVSRRLTHHEATALGVVTQIDDNVVAGHFLTVPASSSPSRLRYSSAI